MTLKEYLSQAIKIERLVETRMEQIEELRKINNYSKSIANLSGSGKKRFRSESKVESVVRKISEAENKLVNDISRFIETRENIHSLLKNIHAADVRNMLERHYLLGHTWEKVAADCYVCTRTVHNLHNTALKKLKPFYSEISQIELTD